MDKSKDVKVITSRGDIVTYEEHCGRVDAYLDEIKAKALQLTASNAALTAYLQSLSLLHGDLIIEGASCKYFEVLTSKVARRSIPTDGSTNVSAMLDEQGCPALYFDFLHIPDDVKRALVGEFLLPRLVRNRTLLLRSVESLITDTLRWVHKSTNKQGHVTDMTFEYRDADFFWLALPLYVHVLVGPYESLRAHLAANGRQYALNGIFLVDTDLHHDRTETDYQQLLATVEQQPIDGLHPRNYCWNIFGIGKAFAQDFTHVARDIDLLLKIGVRETYRLGKLLSSAMDEHDQLVATLRELEPGKNEPHEEIVKQVLTLCLRDDFSPFRLKEQVPTIQGERRRDFIINNSNPKLDFWRNLRANGVQQILVDAKNYADKLNYDDIANTLEYLLNPVFGNFIIIVSRVGMKDYIRLLDAYLSNKPPQIVVVLTDDDLIAMIQHKGEGTSPTLVIEERYHEFRDMK